MNGNGKMKRVTDPLDDKAKARIIGNGNGHLHELGYLSSGSEHSAVDADCDSNELVFGFPEDNYAAQNQSPKNETGSDSGEDFPPVNFQIDATDIYRNVLCSHVYKALEVHSYLRSSNKSLLRRNVMVYLRDCGYNAAICKAKWESSGGLTAGSYEFIDVLRSDSADQIIARYFVDIEFAAEFEIARPTSSYERLLQSLPEVFVGKTEELKQMLRAMSDAARQSLKRRRLHLPPWRKYRFMQNKWLGPYKRTMNIFPSANTQVLFPPLNQVHAVKCRSVGFNADVNGGLWLPAMTQTR